MDISDQDRTWRVQAKTVTNLRTMEVRILEERVPESVLSDPLPTFVRKSEVAFLTGYWPGTKRCPCCDSIIN